MPKIVSEFIRIYAADLLCRQNFQENKYRQVQAVSILGRGIGVVPPIFDKFHLLLEGGVYFHIEKEGKISKFKLNAHFSSKFSPSP